MRGLRTEGMKTTVTEGIIGLSQQGTRAIGTLISRTVSAKRASAGISVGDASLRRSMPSKTSTSSLPSSSSVLNCTCSVARLSHRPASDCGMAYWLPIASAATAMACSSKCRPVMHSLLSTIACAMPIVFRISREMRDLPVASRPWRTIRRGLGAEDCRGQLGFRCVSASHVHWQEEMQAPALVAHDMDTVH